MHAPFSMPQSLAVLSSDADNIEVPSLENAVDHARTPRPVKVWMHAPLSMLHSLAVLLADVVATEVPSPEDVAAFTKSP